jgi:hypothetical protein
MDFFMPACTRRDFLRTAVAIAVMAAARPSHADGGGIRLDHAEINQKGELFQLSGNFDIQLSPTLENALMRGVQLTFIQAFEAERLRDFWLAEEPDRPGTQRIRLSYNALLRQYYVSLSGVSSTHESTCHRHCVRRATCATGRS